MLMDHQNVKTQVYVHLIQLLHFIIVFADLVIQDKIVKFHHVFNQMVLHQIVKIKLSVYTIRSPLLIIIAHA